MRSRPARPAIQRVEPEDLRERAIGVLAGNRRPGYVAPARVLYVHQHLWDTCFVAIGQRHFDVDGAMEGLRRLLAAQWSDGMVPNIRFEKGLRYWWDRRVWRSRSSPSSPPGLATGGVSQPPMIAEAVVRVGEVLPRDRRMAWYESVYPALVAYHEWLHADHRGAAGELSIQIHPWETGLDNSPPLVELLSRSPVPWWVDVMAHPGLERMATRLRWDARHVPADQRSSTAEALCLYSALARIRRRRYDRRAALEGGPFAIEDLACNAILARADVQLQEIGREIGLPLPEGLDSAIRRHRSALEGLWDAGSECYYSRDARTGELILEPSIAALTPLYAGCIDEVRAKRLVQLLLDPDVFGTPYPVPSVPVGSRRFRPCRYWQGPTWVNMNWLVIDGLRRYGFAEEAERLRLATLALVATSGFREYYNPLTGEPAGADGFSWTAALTVDLLAEGPPG